MIEVLRRWARPLLARPRLLTSALVAVLVAALLPAQLVQQPTTRGLVGWNIGVWLYLLMAALMMVRSPQAKMQRRAQLEDAGRYVVLGVAIVAAVASLLAIAVELAVAKEMHGEQKAARIALAGLTVFSSWLFTHLMFALHYAHDYYLAVAQGQKGGLQFPGEEAPDYGDFFYFAAVIGTSGQTADVSFTSKPMRRLGALHCVLSFLFNTTLLALTINIAASAF